MGNVSSRNDYYPVPTTWNPFKRSQMKKREKVLREYLYTTPMILQYPGAYAGAQNYFFTTVKQPS
jgi:hypothetical protein